MDALKLFTYCLLFTTADPVCETVTVYLLKFVVIIIDCLVGHIWTGPVPDNNIKLLQRSTRNHIGV